MIGFKAYRSTPTTLDLNGPILSYTTQPVGLTTESSSINLVGIVTSLPQGGTGEIAYQWYEVGYGPISSGSTITGTATTTLTLNELNFNDSGREFYLEAGYNASAYGVGPITAGTARSTGNAVNAPLNSDTVEIQVGPTIVILQQPVSSTIAVNNDATFSVLASIGSSTGAGVPSPCIAVIDETSPSQNDINDDWTAFRNKWPSRPFNIFRVPRSSGNYSGVKVPSVAPTDYNVENVNRDDGDVSDASDWFTLANLSGYAAGTTVTLWVDDSGSMREASVSASYNKFLADCATAGLLIEYRTSAVNSENGIHAERYIWPFIDVLVGTAEEGDPNLVYQWKVNGEIPVDTTTRTVTGGATRILTLNDTVAGIHTVACSISYLGAVNSPLLSDVVNYDVAGSDVSRSILHLEEFDVNATLYGTRVVNLEDEALEIIPSSAVEPTSDWNRIYSIYAPEEDVTVRITMSGAAGGEGTPGNAGGEGGISIWTMTLTQQQEYVVNLGARIWPSGGSPAAGGFSGGGNGGGGSFFYQGGELLVACGGGGGGGSQSSGGNGFGGGIGDNPQLTSTGYFPWQNAPGDQSTANIGQQNPGQVARCTIGDYWADQGIAPCVSIGSTTFFTGQNGQKSTSIFTTPVIRGYKAGLNYQFNGGNGDSGSDGGGGGGARGGGGSSNGNGGGGGGTGFAGITIDSATRGGNTGVVGTIKIEKV